MDRFARSRPPVPATDASGKTRVARALRVQRWALAAGALGVLAVVSWPLVFTSATFNEDWLNHLWYMWHQSLAIREHGTPSLFLNYADGVFYPLYAFYGGTLYTLGGGLSLLLGDMPLQTYILTYLLGFAAAYGGLHWLARTLGVRGWRAHVPAIVFVTAAPYLMTIYAFGDWPEFIATSMLPMLIAATLSVLRAPRLRFWPALALALSGVVFFGSHLLTLVWGGTILCIVVVALIVGVPAARRGVTRAGALHVAALVIPAAMVSAWFLLPTAAYEAHTVIAHGYHHWQKLLREFMFTVSASNLFTLSHEPVPGTIVSSSLPVAAIAWTFVAVATGARGRRGTYMRVLAIVIAATVGLAIVMTHADLILALPRMYSSLQFSFRLESLVVLGVCVAMTLVLAIARDGGTWMRRWTWLLAPVAAISIAGALQQTIAHRQGVVGRSHALSFAAPLPERYAQVDYDDLLPLDGASLPFVEFPLATIASEGHASTVVAAPADRLLLSNLMGGPELVHVTGAKIVAIAPRGNDVLELPRAPHAGAYVPAQGAGQAATITVSAAEPPPVLVGRWLSLIALVALVGELGVLAARDLRRNPLSKRKRRRHQVPFT
jgi:hypothetical protein